MNFVCVKCQAPFGMKRTGVTVIKTTGNPPMPASIWRANLLACPICGAEMLAHFGHEPVAEQHEAGFKAALAGVNGDRYVVYSPEKLAKIVQHETRYVKGGKYGPN